MTSFNFISDHLRKRCYFLKLPDTQGDFLNWISVLIDDLNSISKGFVPPKIKAAIRRAKIARIRRVYLYGGIVGLFVLLIATAITQALQLKLTGQEKRRLTKRYTEDTEAYQLLLKGRYLLNRRTPKGMKKSIVWIYASLGEKDKAFEWLQKAYDQRDFFIHQMKVEPLLDPLRSDPRFQDLMHRMNFPE